MDSDNDGYVPIGQVNETLSGRNSTSVIEIAEFYGQQKYGSSYVEQSKTSSNSLNAAVPEASLKPSYQNLGVPINQLVPSSSSTPPYFYNQISGSAMANFYQNRIAPNTELFRPNQNVTTGMFHQHSPMPPIGGVPIPLRPMLFPPSPPHFLPMNMYPHPQMYIDSRIPPLRSMNPQIGHIPAFPPIPSLFNAGMMIYPNQMQFIPQISPFSVINKQPLSTKKETDSQHVLSETVKRSVVDRTPKLEVKEECKRGYRKTSAVTESSDQPAARVQIKKKKYAKIDESANGKFANFSKDMFVIRLRDVDSFDRNNEIWRIDNHILIQKFCGVASLRAPARQFQSSNRLSGYDARATWRLFIINPENVEVDNHGAEITVHNFPSIDVLREAKALAELKDEEFKTVEKQEYIEKMHRFEEKQLFKTAEKRKRILEKKMRRQTLNGSLSNWSSGIDSDKKVCRAVIDELLDTLEKHYEDRSHKRFFFSDESGYSDEEEDDDDPGSLHSLVGSTDSEASEMKFKLYSEDEVPVGLEMTVD